MMRAYFMNPTCLRQRGITRGWMSVLLMALWVVMVADSDAQERDEPLNPQYEKLLNQLGDDSFQVRERATQELIERGLRVRVEVIAASDSPDLEIRSRASRIIKTWTTDKLVRLLGDDSMMVRQKATNVLLQRGPTVRAEMATALDGADAEIRSQAQRIYEEWSLTEYLLENPNEIDFLNPKQAAEIVSRYPDQLSLPNVTFFFKGRVVARELAGHRGALALDGLKSIDEETARELLRFEGSSLSLNGLTTIDSGVARELLKFEGGRLSLDGLKSIYDDVTFGLEMLAGLESPDAEIRSRARRLYEEWRFGEYLLNNPGEIVSLNPKQAAQLVSKYPGTLSLPNLTVIVNGKEVGRELAKSKGYLSLGGLQSIDKDFARELATSSARRLDLDGLTSVDKEVARELAQFKGRYLWLRKLKSIDKDVARELASFKNELRLDGLTSIDKDVAQELSKFTAYMYLDGLTSIGKDVAQLLAKSTARGLSFNGLESIDKGVVRELVSFQGGLYLNGLKSMDQDVAQELAKFDGRTLHLGGLKSVDEGVLQQLEEWKVRYLSLNGLEAINTGLARALAKSKVGSVNFYGVASIDEEVAQELAKFEGEYLCLGGLKSMDKGVAQKLANLKARRLNLQALEFMEKDVAQELAKFKGELAMFCLKSMDKEVALALARYSGTKMSFGTYLKVSDEVILEVLRSNPKIELPQKYRNSKKASQGTE